MGLSCYVVLGFMLLVFIFSIIPNLNLNVSIYGVFLCIVIVVVCMYEQFCFTEKIFGG